MRIRTLLVASAALRAVLIAYGEFQDAFMSVKYTDIDYNVFTDAARFVVQGESPFMRSTYRYSPLLAYLVVPNVLMSHVFGKVLFAAGDVLAGWQLWRLARSQRVPETAALWAVVAWMYNPFTLTISTRGSCDVLVVNMLLAVLQMLFSGHLVAPALLYGLAVHFRIYPIIYAPAIVFFVAQRALAVQQQRQQRPSTRTVKSMGPMSTPFLLSVLRRGAEFGFISGGVFILLGLLFYRMYGQLFLHEAFLHHLSRKDPRHNFSAYFYHIYLTFLPSAPGSTSAAAGWLDPGRLAFLPQGALLLVLAAALHAHLPFCWLLQTIAFVAFNKVSTAQYFVWYFSLLPLVLPHIPWPLPRRLVIALAMWVALQLHWLFWGAMLELRGLGVYLPLWAASVAFLVANTALMAALVSAYRPPRSFLAASVEQERAGHSKRAA